MKLQVCDLRVSFDTPRGVLEAVRGVSFEVGAGETVGIVGESGCGKSVTALSLLRLIGPPGRITGGCVMLDGRDLLRASEADMRRLRGSELSMIFQDPMTSLNPVFSVGQQLDDVMRAHGVADRAERRKRALQLLESVGIPSPASRIGSYPHQFSGGMRQRVMIAMALANRPSVLVADEPTTALDVTVQAQILALLKDLNRTNNTAIVLISHDLGVVAELCERILVFYAGEIVESGFTRDLLANPKHPYTRALLQSVPRPTAGERQPLRVIAGAPPSMLPAPVGCAFAPRCEYRFEPCDQRPPLFEAGGSQFAACWLWDPARTRAGVLDSLTVAANGSPAKSDPKTVLEPCAPLVKVSTLVRHFASPAGTVRAVDGVDLSINAGETLGLVGESGCGKSTLGRTILRLYPVSGGRIEFDGADITAWEGERLRAARRHMQMIFQDPLAALNPRMRVGEMVAEPLGEHGIGRGAERHQRVRELFDLVALPWGLRERYPSQLSGGQRQRVGIARALAVHPRFIVADEAVSALDVSVGAQIVNLLEDLRSRLGIAYLFISHNLSVVHHISDRVAVMYLGRIVELGPTAAIFAEPLHPYTTAVLSATPQPDPDAPTRRERIILQGDPPSPIDPPSACRFRTRCPIGPLARPERSICAGIDPPLVEHRPGHFVACHFPGELTWTVA